MGLLEDIKSLISKEESTAGAAATTPPAPAATPPAAPETNPAPQITAEQVAAMIAEAVSKAQGLGGQPPQTLPQTPAADTAPAPAAPPVPPPANIPAPAPAAPLMPVQPVSASPAASTAGEPWDKLVQLGRAGNYAEINRMYDTPEGRKEINEMFSGVSLGQLTRERSGK